MPSLMERGMKLLNRAAPVAAGGRIIYQRGSDRVWIDAAFGRTEYSVEINDAVRIELTDRDFIFAAECLILGGKLATPQKGDRITVVNQDHSYGHVFEVLPIDGNKQCYRSCDSTGHTIRVYAKRVTA